MGWEMHHGPRLWSKNLCCAIYKNLRNLQRKLDLAPGPPIINRLVPDASGMSAPTSGGAKGIQRDGGSFFFGLVLGAFLNSPFHSEHFEYMPQSRGRIAVDHLPQMWENGGRRGILCSSPQAPKNCPSACWGPSQLLLLLHHLSPRPSAGALGTLMRHNVQTIGGHCSRPNRGWTHTSP